MFELLREPAYFARVSVDPAAGTIACPNDSDMAPEPLYEQARTTAVEAASSAS